jgi:hypothetical protein
MLECLTRSERMCGTCLIGKRWSRPHCLNTGMMTTEYRCMPLTLPTGHERPTRYASTRQQKLMPNQKCIMVDSSWTNSDDCYSSSRSMPSWATTPRYIPWIRYHDANKSLVWKPNTEAVNATTSERAAIIGSMGSRILSTQLSPSSLAYCTWAEA